MVEFIIILICIYILACGYCWLIGDEDDSLEDIIGEIRDERKRKKSKRVNKSMPMEDNDNKRGTH